MVESMKGEEIDSELKQIIKEVLLKELKVNQNSAYTTKDEVMEVICEEYGVSREVVDKTHEVCGWLENEMVGRGENNRDENGILTYNGSISIKCFGIKVVIKYTIYNYHSKREYDSTDKKKFKGEVNSREKNITLIVAAVNKRLVKDSRSVTQHELHHFLETVRMDNEKSLGNQNDRYFYNKALDNLALLKARKYREDGDAVRYLLNIVVYYSLDSEIRAFANSLDSYIRNNNVHDSNVLKNSETYGALDLIKKVLKLWSGIEPYAKEEFGVESGKCLDMIKRGEKGYIKAIGRVLAKYNLQAINENIYASPNINWFDSYGRIFDEIDEEVNRVTLEDINQR